MLGKVLGTILGLIVAMAMVSVIEQFGHFLYPVPSEISRNDPEVLREMVEGLPLGALLFVILAWFVGTFCGCLIAGLIAKEQERVLAMIVGGLLMIAGIINMVMIPHPIWFWITGILSFLIAAHCGFTLAAIINRKRRSM